MIAHYNNFVYFQDCLESILVQTYQNFEVVIVDDCSSDGSFLQLQNLLAGDTRFRLFQNQENRGIGFTKRKCVELASGEICAFLDPDDALAPNAIEESIAAYQSSNIVGTHSAIDFYDQKMQFLKKFNGTKAVRNNNPFFFNLRYELNHFFTFKKSAYLETTGINPELKSAIDQDLYLKIYERGKLQYIPESLYHYRLHQNGVSQDSTKKDNLKQNLHKVLSDTIRRRHIH